MPRKTTEKKVKNSVALSGPSPAESPIEQRSSELLADPQACSTDHFLDPDRPLMTEQQQAELAGAGVYSARGLKRTRPEIYDGITRALNEGIGVRSIAAAYKTSVHTVYAIREREYRPNWADKSKVRAMIKKLVGFTLERIEDELPSLPADKLPVLAGILIDKMQALDGEPGQIVEHRHAVTLEAWKDVIQGLPEAPEKPVEGAVIDVER